MTRCPIYLSEGLRINNWQKWHLIRGSWAFYSSFHAYLFSSTIQGWSLSSDCFSPRLITNVIHSTQGPLLGWAPSILRPLTSHLCCNWKLFTFGIAFCRVWSHTKSLFLTFSGTFWRTHSRQSFGEIRYWSDCLMMSCCCYLRHYLLLVPKLLHLR